MYVASTRMIHHSFEPCLKRRRNAPKIDVPNGCMNLMFVRFYPINAIYRICLQRMGGLTCRISTNRVRQHFYVYKPITKNHRVSLIGRTLEVL